jgi:hypothetical protein
MSKYAPLEQFLRGQRTQQVPLTFAEIERIIGAALPSSARNHRAWWSNNPSNSVITEAWLNAGYRTEQVDMDKGRLTFRRTDKLPHGSPPAVAAVVRHPLFGALKGLMRIMPGTDLTQPADPDWGKDN